MALKTVISEIYATLKNIIGHYFVQKVKSGKLPIITATGIDDIEATYYQPYGFATLPLAGAEAIAATVGGTDYPVIMVVSDRRYAPTDLKPGDVVLYDNRGHKIVLSSALIKIISSLTQIDGNLHVRGSAAILNEVTCAAVTSGQIMTGNLQVGGAAIPLPGFTGSFSTGSQTVTVVNGIITSIT